VAQDSSVESRAHAGAQAGTWSGPWSGHWPWPVGGIRPPWHVIWPRASFAPKTQLWQWAAQEIAADRLLPWLAVAYGFGVVIYFTADREPAWWAAATLAAVCGVGAIVLRRHLVAFVVGLFVFAIAAGFAAATVKTAMIEHPVLHYPASGVTIAGFVELREESQHTDRFVLRVDRIDANRIDDKPQRVRLSVKRGLAPPAGSFVEVKAMLDPPLQPLAPPALSAGRSM
jgi:competence protein ComEC